MHGTITTFRPRGQSASTPTPRIRPIVSGRGLAHARLSAWQRAELILNVVAGEKDIALSWRQLAAIAGVSVGTLRAARAVWARPLITRHNGRGR
jgi:hypothetical protein